MTRVEWTYTVETSRFLRILALAGAGALAGFFGLVAAGLVFVVGVSLLSGDFAVLALLLGATLLGARRLATSVALFDSDVPTAMDFLPARELAAACLAWAVALAALVALDIGSRAVYAVVVVVVTLCLSLAALLHSEGYVDTDEAVLDANRGEASLAAVAGVSRYDLGSAAVLRVHYHDGAGSSAPRLLTVPVAKADAVERALVSSDADPPESDRNPLIAKTLYAFALGSFGVAAAFAYFAATESGDATGVGVYVAAFVGLFGLLFAWLGYVEG